MKGHIEDILAGGRPMTKNEIKIKELQQRINKAIETIKDEGLVVAIKITNGEKEQLLSSKDLLLDILKGSEQRVNCNYCNKTKEFEEQANKRLIDKSFNNQIDTILEIDKDKLVLWCDNLTYYDKEDWLKNSDKITSKKINYCPMCGRKLGSDKE